MMVPNLDEGTSVAVIIATIILMLQNAWQSRKAKEVKDSLTKNNGGSSVKDYLDEFKKDIKFIRNSQENVDERLERIEDRQNYNNAKIDAVDAKINKQTIKIIKLEHEVFKEQ